MNDGWHKARALAGKRLLDFIQANPEGVTYKEIKSADLTTFGLDLICRLGYVTARQVREPERGKRAYHYVWTATAPTVAQGEVNE